MAYTPKENEWLFNNEIEDSLIRVGYLDDDGYLQYKIIGGNYEPIAVSHEPDGFSSLASCAKQANSLVARSEHDELKAFIYGLGRQIIEKTVLNVPDPEEQA